VQTCDLFSAAATTMDSSNSVSLDEQTKLRELTSAKGTSQLSNFHQKKIAKKLRTLNITYLLLLQSTQETSIDKSFKLFLQQKYGR